MPAAPAWHARPGQAALQGTQQPRVRPERAAVAQPQPGHAAASRAEHGRQVGVAVIGLGEQQRQHHGRAAAAVAAQGLERVGNGRQRVSQVGGPDLQAAQPGAAGPGPHQVRQFRDRRRGPGVGAAVRGGDQRRRPGPARPGTAQVWIPHSVLPVPAQRPLRASAPASTRAVQVAQPIDG